MVRRALIFVRAAGSGLSIPRRACRGRGVAGLYLYVNGTLPAVSTQLSVIYAEHQSNDKLLYIVFDTESTYG